MPPENIGISAQRRHAFLNARAAAVVDDNERTLHLNRHVHDMTDFFGMILAQRAADDGKILGRRAGCHAADFAESGYDAVARHAPSVHAEIIDSGFNQLSDLNERARIKQQFQPLPRAELARRLLFLHTPCAAAHFRPFAQRKKLLCAGMPKRCHLYRISFKSVYPFC